MKELIIMNRRWNTFKMLFQTIALVIVFCYVCGTTRAQVNSFESNDVLREELNHTFGNLGSKEMRVGKPRFILTVTHEPGAYLVQAKCIDEECQGRFTDKASFISYKWGVKYPDSNVEWMESSSPFIRFQMKNPSDKLLVFFQYRNNAGHISPLQHIEISNQSLYIASNLQLYIDGKGKLYKESLKPYDISYARIFLNHNPSAGEKYKESRWLCSNASVITPSGECKSITVQSEGPLVKQILSTEDLQFIINHSEENQSYKFTLVLQNHAHQTLQILPVTFTFKNHIK